MRASVRKWREKNPEYHPAWNDANRDKLREYWRKYEKKPSRISQKREAHLVRKFGLALDDFVELVARQGGVCAACGEPEGEGRALRFAVDHCHETGQVCGIIHDRCNRVAGVANDNADLLVKITEYVRKTRKA